MSINYNTNQVELNLTTDPHQEVPCIIDTIIHYLIQLQLVDIEDVVVASENEVVDTDYRGRRGNGRGGMKYRYSENISPNLLAQIDKVHQQMNDHRGVQPLYTG
eukprot:241113_1